MNFDFETFDLEKFLDNSPTIGDVRNLLADLDTERFYLVEEITHIEDKYGIKVQGEIAEKFDRVEDMMWRVGHLLMNNAMHIISDGAENEFIYVMTIEDKEDYRFSMFTLAKVVKVIYGGYLGTIDLELGNGETIADDDLDCQDMEMLATYFYEIAVEKLLQIQ